MKAAYYVYTWDLEQERFAPQKGVRCGPYRLMGLRRALRQLAGMGYCTKRYIAPLVLVTTKPEHEPRRRRRLGEEMPLFGRA